MTKFSIGLSQLEMTAFVAQSDDAIQALEAVRIALGRGRDAVSAEEDLAVLIPVHKYKLQSPTAGIQQQDTHWQFGESVARARGAAALKNTPNDGSLVVKIWSRLVLAPTRAQIQIAATMFLLRTFVGDLLRGNCTGCQVDDGAHGGPNDNDAPITDADHTLVGLCGQGSVSHRW